MTDANRPQRKLSTAGQSLYVTLGLEKGASAEDMKKAYRCVTWSHRHHVLHSVVGFGSWKLCVYLGFKGNWRWSITQIKTPTIQKRLRSSKRSTMPTPFSPTRPSGRFTTSTALWACTSQTSSEKRRWNTTSYHPNAGSRWGLNVFLLMLPIPECRSTPECWIVLLSRRCWCWRCCSRAAAVVSAAVSVVGNVEARRTKIVSSTWIRKSWRPRCPRSRKEVSSGCMWVKRVQLEPAVQHALLLDVVL